MVGALAEETQSPHTQEAKERRRKGLQSHNAVHPCPI